MRWLLLLLVCACGREQPSVPASVDAWARKIIAMPASEVCAGDVDRYFCQVKDSLLTPDVRAIGAHSISLQRVQSSERYVDIDFGGGHVDAYGVIVGPVGWMHVADSERRERRLRDGVFAYDTRL